MTTNTPKVLVVLPTLGHRIASLDAALGSIQRQRDDISLTAVMVTPTSAREARRLAKRFNVLVVDDPGRGMSAAINEGLRSRTTEEYYIWLGDDDQYRPGGLAALASLLDQYPDAVVAYGACDYVGDDGRVLWTSQAGALARMMIGIGPNLIPHPAAMMRLDAVDSAGGYDESLSLVMDLDLLLRLKREGHFIATREVVSAFGWHPESLTVSDRKMSGAEARMVKRRYLGSVTRILEPLWEYPVSWASQVAAHTLNRRHQHPSSD